MKIYRFFLMILCFVISQHSFAQDPILFEGIWELESITLNGEVFFPPSNDEVAEVTLSFLEENSGNSELPETIIGSVCDAFSASVIFQEADSSLPTFMFGDDYVTTLGECSEDINQNFQNIYFTFYEASLLDPFEYLIEFLGNNPALIITSSNGDTATYGNPILSVSDVETPSFSIYPNPSSDQLYIETNQEMGDYMMTVFDMQGKQQLTTPKEMLGANPLDIQNWASGVYFVRLENQKGVMTIQRFIKK